MHQPRLRKRWIGCFFLLLEFVLAACGGAEYQWRPLASKASPDPVYPLAVSASRRYFVDQNGAPVLLHGDAAWSLITALTKPEAEAYLEDRRRTGFNAIIVNLIEHKFNGTGEPRRRGAIHAARRLGCAAPSSCHLVLGDAVLVRRPPCLRRPFRISGGPPQTAGRRPARVVHAKRVNDKIVYIES